MTMYNLNTRLRRLESKRAAIQGTTCPLCGAFLGKPDDIRIMPLGTPPCIRCGQPYQVTLNLGRRVLNEYEIAGKANEDETDLFINEIRDLLG